MLVLENLLKLPKRRRVAVIMALLGTVTPIAGLHKFYLGQPFWGLIYFLCWSTPIPRIASAIEVVWYLIQDKDDFDRRFNFLVSPSESSTSIIAPGIDPERVKAIANALRELDKLRSDGLMSEYEFEQKRRQLLDRIA